jgi:hypothetical protein
MTMRLFGLLAALCVANTCLAQITLSLMPNTLSAAPGATVTFAGTISNASPTDTVFLNGLAGSFSSPNLQVDAPSFLSYAPISLAPNTSYTGNLFDVLVAGLTGAGTYSGSVQLTGGLNDTAQSPLTTFQSIFVNVGAAVPEPGSLCLLGLGGALLLLRRRVTPSGR